MTRVTRWLSGCAGLVMTVASCGARDSNSADGLDAGSSNPSYLPTAEQQIRAAYVSTRQAESATDPSYSFHPAGRAMEAVHPDTQLRAKVDADGVTLSRAGESWSANLHTAGIGCHSVTGKIASRDATANTLGHRVQVDKSVGDQRFTEWYLQATLGLEQGWTLHENPCPAGDTELDVSVSGLAVADGKDGLVLRDASGTSKVHYTDVWARDANGRPLATTMSASGGGIAIRVDTRGAAFPVEVDPLVWTQQQELTASDGSAYDSFGFSVAISGSTAIVGAYAKQVGANTAQGAAYVFVQNGKTWTEQQKLVASDGGGLDYFGSSVAVSGGTAIVGANGNNANQGAAYVFVQSGNTWTEQQKLVASDGVASDYFGISTSVSNGIAVVGALKVNSAATKGAAYVFVQNGTTWTEQQQLVASDGVAGDRMGVSVAISGGTVVAGADSRTSGKGAAYVFVQNGNTWTEQQRLTASDAASNDYLGNSVALSNNTAVVAAPNKKVGANAGQGAAYVFVRSNGVWTEQQKLTASDGASGDKFGTRVSVSGGTAVVGAPDKTVGANAKQGGAYVFAQSGTTWSEQQKLTASNGAAGDLFGSSVAASGVLALVGTESKKVGSNDLQGAAYVFSLGTANGTPCTTPSDCASGSGFCVDGVCCDTACTDVCQACSASAKQSGKDDGTCGAALNGTNPHKDACTIDPPATCGRDGMCDGAGNCRLHPPTGTVCGATCSADQETTSACDGGKCIAGVSKTCGRYVCGATKCKTSCAAKADCITGFVCDTASSACIPDVSCVGNASRRADGSLVQCAPYRCDTNGACKSLCNSVDDCFAPAVCNPSGACVAPGASSSGSSGGCSTSRGDTTPWGLAGWALVGVVTGLRRRWRARRGLL